MKYYISDLHFGHARMNDHVDHRGFNSAAAMDEYMIAQWNSRVGSEDEVFILGDLTIQENGENVNQLLRQLRGEKTLIVGNHDRYLEDQAFQTELFRQITPYLEIRDGGRTVILSHYPIMFYNGQYRMDRNGKPKTYMLYGHVHNGPDEQAILEHKKNTEKRQWKNSISGEMKQVPCQMINCFCMFSDYVPLTLDEWIQVEKRRMEDSMPEKKAF